MDSLVCVGIKGHWLILITDFEDRIFDGPIVETERNLLQIAPATCFIAVIQVGVHLVVPDYSGEGRPLAKPFRGPLGQERRHEMIVALNIKAAHTLWRDAKSAVAPNASEKLAGRERTGRASNCVC